jgi:cystathionine beta-synthase
VTAEKIDLLRAYGATVVVCPAAVPADHPDFYRNTARRLAEQTPGGCLLDQYSNAANPLAHYRSTGPELWRQTGGRITHFVAGMGTGGTISGAGRYLKEVSGGRVRVIGVDPEGSIYTGDQVRPYLLEGVGQPTLPGAYDPAAPDELLSVPDSRAFAMARRLAREEAMLVGGSGGMAVAAALEVAGRLGPDELLVVIIPDSGRSYLSKIFNPGWMAARGFTAESPDLLTATGELVSIGPQETVGAAVAALHKHRLPALPVIAAAAPVRLAEVLGTVSQRELAEAMAFGRARPTDPVRAHMSAPPPFVGTGESLTEALARLGAARFAVVLDGGLVRGLLYDHDIAAYLARMERT